MSVDEWERTKKLFSAALEREPHTRASFVDQACGGDEQLRSEINSLLASYEKADCFIESPVVDDAIKLFNDARSKAAAGRRIGQYELIREIGRGGMGSVYLAARADDQYKKQVAIKLVRQGFDNQIIIGRFLAERQILATLDHKNIARLLDGGTTEEGSPYLVMEYIEGLPIDKYCDRNTLSTIHRLKLFRIVCSAVAYAHRNLVIHRDIKPSNILVTNDGTPKLLDFGIAKLLSPDALNSERTATVARIMTPQYASPEQLRGLGITTASDIYSLGVLLYKLLTGHHPFVFKTLLPIEIEKIICNKEPERPSTAITRVENSTDADGASTGNITPESVSEARSERPEGLRRKLRGDLDNIVLKAMRKEPERRYFAVEQFSEDISRHLEGLPVVATRDTFTYRVNKFVTRNRLGVTAAGIILLSLIAGIVATTWQARVARQEKAKAESINGFLEQMLNYSNPVLRLPGDSSRETTMTQVLDEAAKRLESGEFDDKPEVKAELERIVGKSYLGQGRYALGKEHQQEYVMLERKLYGENHPKTLDSEATWASLLFEKGEMAEAEIIFRQVLPAMRAKQQSGDLNAELLLDALNNFAYLRRTQGDSGEAEALFRESLALSPQIRPELRFVGVTQSTLASTIADQGRFGEALQTAREAVADARHSEEVARPDFGFSLTILGGFLTDKDDFAEADASLHQAEGIFRQLLGPSHLWLGDNLRNQAMSFYRQDKLADAQEKAAEAGKIYLESFGKHYDHYPTVLIIQGLILNKTGKSRQGEAILREAVKLRTDSLPKEHFWVAMANSALAECLATQKRYDEAELLLLESYTDLKASQGEQNPRTQETLRRLVSLYEAWGKPDKALGFRALLP